MICHPGAPPARGKQLVLFSAFWPGFSQEAVSLGNTGKA